jgi:hypothetical protein
MGEVSALAVVISPALHRLIHSVRFVFAGQLCLFLMVVATFAFALWSKCRTMRVVRRTVGMVVRAARIPVYTSSARSRFLEELSRARRYQRKLSVIVFTVACDSGSVPAGTGNGTSLQSRLRSLEDAVFRYPLMGCLIRAGLRENDLVMYDAIRDRYLLLMLEVERPQAFASMERIGDLVLRRTGISVEIGVAEYPTDGWTSEDLISVAESSIETRHTPHPDTRVKRATAVAASQLNGSTDMEHTRREAM